MKRLKLERENQLVPGENAASWYDRLWLMLRGNGPTIPLLICALGMVRIVWTDPFYLSICVVATIVAVSVPKLLKKGQRNAFWVFLTICTTVLMLGVSQIANAQFFQGAETYFTTNFSASSAGITVVFAALRALYIIYLAVSLIGAINAARADEDWMTVARTPTLVVVGVTLADILTTMITG